MNIADLSQNLELNKSGVWTAKQPGEISYPADGNEFCAQLEENSFWFNHRNEIIKAAVRNFPTAGAIFDIGGGNGYVSKALEADGIETVLVEPGEAGARMALQRGVKNVICATLENAAFFPASLSGAGLFDVVEHIEDDAAFLKKLKKLLVAGGRVYLTVPAYNWLWSDEDVTAGHFRRYTRHSLSKVLRQSGFEVEYSTCFFGFLPPAIMLMRTLPSAAGLRRPSKIEEHRKEHSKRRGLVGNMVDKILQAELALVQQKKSLPFGASILAVARN